MHAFAQHRQWNAVQDVHQKLIAAGYKALLAGGCVRDLLMKREPNDFDIASDATPDQVAALFQNALLVGREFGVTIIPYDGFQIEVATFRVDGSYKDGRRPESVIFSTPEEDAKRRDFTVNALFYDLAAQKVIDYVGGQADIKARLIRAVGDPVKRFTEDKLRLIRAVRFAAQLEFTIEEKTFAAIKALSSEISVVSSERIRDELTKLLKTKYADLGFLLLVDTGLASATLPELKELFEDRIFAEKVGERLRRGADSVEMAWLNLLYDPAAKLKRLDEIRNLLKRLKLSNQEADAIIWTLKNKDIYLKALPMNSPILIRALAHPASKTAEAFLSKQPEVDAANKEIWRKVHADVLANARRLPNRFINGDDLQKLGVAKGPKLGLLLEEVFDRQLDGTLKSKAEAEIWVKAHLA